VSLLAHLPAQLVFPKQSGKLQFRGIGGSVWRGEVEQVLYSGIPLPVNGLSWSVSPASLFLGNLEADVQERQNPSNHGGVKLDLFSRQLDLHAVQWRLPAELLDSWLSMLGSSARGDFSLDLQTLQLPRGETFPSELQGRFEWQGALVRNGSQTWPIGSPAMQFAEEGGVIRGVVTNSQPLLPGDGTFQCEKKSCRVTLSVKPAPDTPQSVLDALRFMGLQRSGDTFSGQLTLPLE